VVLMPSADAPSVSFNEEELARLRELRRAFLRSQGVYPLGQDENSE
jgi:hypothetical protein